MERFVDKNYTNTIGKSKFPLILFAEMRQKHANIERLR
jgi:hypothetical protein